MHEKGILRLLDANYNRSKEGLRVIEDIFRFILKNNALRKRIRTLRHYLNQQVQKEILKNAIESRESKQDLGKKIDHLELNRKNLSDILYANFQRVKESLRVLEEFSKLIAPRYTNGIKKMRYDLYAIEKKASVALRTKT
ncbi:MAG: thiamine-phosphate pyrophosphorylase [Candidatus Omnitrophica bacterium]|jgi:thiamine-phosphate pyrophosphorylase|nr:thiamine-phosphate pyrophosphorylase [Candidatus Omnitrophota bacterium]